MQTAQAVSTLKADGFDGSCRTWHIPDLGESKIQPATARPVDLLADTLFAATQFKALQLLFLRPGHSLFASEVIALAASGSGAVKRELARLVESGLVTRTLIGRQRHYQANPDSPIFEELHGIAIKIAGIPERLNADLQPIIGRVELAILYGSMAKGTAKSGSDIDVLIVGDGIRLDELYSCFESTERALRRKVHPTLYSIDEFKRRRKGRSSFLVKIFDGETVLLAGKSDAVQTPRQSRTNRKAQG